MNEQELIHKYNKMIWHIANKYSSIGNKHGLAIDDLCQEGAIGVIKGIRTYSDKPNTNVNSWIYNNIKWQILRALPKEDTEDEKIFKRVSLDAPIVQGEGTTLLDITEDTSDLVTYAGVENNMITEWYNDYITDNLKGTTQLIGLHILHHNDNVSLMATQFNISNDAVRTHKATIRRVLLKNEYIRKKIQSLKKEKIVQSINLYRDNPSVSICKLEQINKLNI